MFRNVYSNEWEFRECRQLNYLAVCDADDGNYQSLLLRPEFDQRVFLLFHELFYRPLSENDREFNYTIAESLSAWLALIAAVTGGWAGRGAVDKWFCSSCVRLFCPRPVCRYRKLPEHQSRRAAVLVQRSYTTEREGSRTPKMDGIGEWIEVSNPPFRRLSGGRANRSLTIYLLESL